jgi:hypothetical protein
MDDHKRQFRQLMIAQAAANKDRTTYEVAQLIKCADLVGGVYPKPASEDGFGIYLIKGRKRFETSRSIAKFNLSSDVTSAPMIITAIPCRDRQQAIEDRKSWGEWIGADDDGFEL